MFCTNCGKQNEEDMAFCIHCGSPMPQAEQPAAYCTNCGEQLREDDDFCIHCGFGRQPVEPEPPKCPGCGDPVEPGVSFCIRCGTSLQPVEPEPPKCPGCGDPVEPGVKFCIRCGTALQPAEQAAPAQTLPVESKGIAMDLLFLCLPVLLTVVSNIYLWKYRAENWFIYSCDDTLFCIFAIMSWIVPLLCLWAGVSRKAQRRKCRIARVFVILDMLLPLALLHLMITRRTNILSQNLPYMALYLSRIIAAILALFRWAKKEQ